MTHFAQYLLELPPTAAILVKLTLLLSLGWLLHFLFVRSNPRWQVLLWRGILVGIVLLPMTEAFLPKFQIEIQPSLQPSLQPVEAAPVASPMLDAVPLMPAETLSAENIKVREIANSIKIAVSKPIAKPNPLLLWIKDHPATIFFASWLLINGVLLIRLTFVARRLRRVVQGADAVPDDVLDIAKRVASDIGWNGRVDVRSMPGLGSPFLAGIWRPVVVLPTRMLDEQENGELTGVFAHEIAHMNAHDPLWLMATQIASSLLWFHPLVWRVHAAHNTACEEVCDAVAADYVGSREEYSGTLARAALAVLTDSPAPGGLPMIRGARITRRLAKLRRGLKAAMPPRKWLVASFALGALVLMGIGSLKLVQAKAEPESAQTPTNESALPAPDASSEMLQLIAVEDFNEGFDTTTQPNDEEQNETSTTDTTVTDGEATEDALWSLEELIAQLSDKDWWLRKVAAQELGKTGESGAVPFLIQALKDEDARVGAAAANSLGQLQVGDTQTIKHLVAALKEKEPIHGAVAKALARFDDPQVLKLLKYALLDEHAPMQYGAIAALGEIGSRDAVELLIDAYPSMGPAGILTETNYRVSTPFLRRVRDAMAKVDHDVLKAPFLAALRSENETVVHMAAFVLGASGTDWAKRALLDLSKERPQSEIVASGLVRGLSAFEGDDINATLASFLDHPEQGIREEVARFLVRRGYVPESAQRLAAFHIALRQYDLAVEIGEAAVEPLVATLGNHGDPGVRRKAAISLGEIGSPEAVGPLRNALNDTTVYVQTSAVQALGSIGDAVSVEALCVALKEADRGIRHEAALALGATGAAASVEPLCAALKDVDEVVQGAAALSLGNLGDTRAIDPLCVVLNDPSENVRSAAAEALGKIGDPRAVEALGELLLTYDPSTRNTGRSRQDLTKAVSALEVIGDPQIQQILEKLVSNYEKTGGGDSLWRKAKSVLERMKKAEAMEVTEKVWAAEKAKEEAEKARANAGQRASNNNPKSWVYFESKESTKGQPPQLSLSFENGIVYVPVSQDSVLISYLADRAWGNHPSLSISLNDTNRALLSFDVARLASRGPLRKADLVLDMKNSTRPVVESFELAVHRVESQWEENNARWNNQPAFFSTPALTATIEAEPAIVRLDVTELAKEWLAETIPNRGLLLKAASPLEEPPPTPRPQVGNKVHTTEEILSTDAEEFFEEIVNPKPGYEPFSGLRTLVKKAEMGDSATKDKIVTRAIEIIQDTSGSPFFQRWQCCYVLSGARDERAIPVLAQVLREGENKTIRGVAACALGEFSMPAAKTALEKATEHEQNAEVLSEIKKALAGEYKKE